MNEAVLVWMLVIVPYISSNPIPEFPLVHDLSSCKRMQDSLIEGTRRMQNAAPFAQCVQILVDKPVSRVTPIYLPSVEMEKPSYKLGNKNENKNRFYLKQL